MYDCPQQSCGQNGKQLLEQIGGHISIAEIVPIDVVGMGGAGGGGGGGGAEC